MEQMAQLQAVKHHRRLALAVGDFRKIPKPPFESRQYLSSSIRATGSQLTPSIEAATIPLAATTASLALYRSLALPPPWHPTTERTPLLIYGGSSAVGAFAIKLASRSNLHPIIAVAGAGAKYVSSLLDASRGDTVIDYRVGRDALEEHPRRAE